jgi:hypothetical protein
LLVLKKSFIIKLWILKELEELLLVTGNKKTINKKNLRQIKTTKKTEVITK